MLKRENLAKFGDLRKNTHYRPQLFTWLETPKNSHQRLLLSSDLIYLHPNAKKHNFEHTYHQICWQYIPARFRELALKYNIQSSQNSAGWTRLRIRMKQRFGIIRFVCKAPICLQKILYCICHTVWIDWLLWTRTGGWEFDRSHGTGTSSPSYWQQVEEQTPKPVDWMCILLMNFVPVQKLRVSIYIYIYLYVCILYKSSVIGRLYIQQECGSVLVKLHPIIVHRTVFWECAVPGLNATFCFLSFTNCVLLYDKKVNSRMLVTVGICLKQHFDTRYLAFCNLAPPRMFLLLALLSEYRIQHGAIGPLYVTSSYSTWIFCRGVSGFATDCPSSVWCHGFTTCSCMLVHLLEIDF